MQLIITIVRRTKFPLGQLVATPGALEAFAGQPTMLELYVNRHAQGDWGVVCDEDKASNDEALLLGNRILSAYPIDPSKPCEGFGDNCVWIVTEADRSVTTVLLPEEY